MENKVKEIQKTVAKLLSLLNQYDNNQISHQINQLEEILYIIKYLDSAELKFNKITRIVDSLYPIRGGLTDFYVWKEDTTERIKINKPISELNDKLWELTRS